jgi:glycine cleavage system H protein
MKNSELDESAELVNSDPYGKGWMIKMAADDLSEMDALMDAEAYKKLIGA